MKGCELCLRHQVLKYVWNTKEKCGLLEILKFDEMIAVTVTNALATDNRQIINIYAEYMCTRPVRRFYFQLIGNKWSHENN